MVLQERLISKIIQTYPSQSEAIEGMSSVLSLSKSNIYRKVTGEITLKPSEIESLSRHYNISLDALFLKNQAVYAGTHQNSSGNADIIQVLKNQITYFEKNGSMSDFVGYAYVNEIPIAYFGDYPSIQFFKFTQWNRLSTSSTKKDSTNRPVVYNLNNMSQEFVNLNATVTKLYGNYSGVQIWDKRGFNLYFEQLRYSYNNGLISQKDSLELLEVFGKAIDDLEKRVTFGFKEQYGTDKNLEVYYSAIPIINNWWIAYSPTECERNHVLMDFDPPRVVTFTDPNIIDKMLQRFHHLKKRCIKISETGEVTRRKLFNHYRKQLYKVRKEIE